MEASKSVALTVPQTYESCLSQMFHWNLQRRAKANYKQKESLEVMQKLSTLFDNPHHNFKTVHVAGTNGKGSVTIKVARALQQAGYKTGMYISPHLSCFRERISINGEMISEAEVLSYYQYILHMLEKTPELVPGHSQEDLEETVKVTFFELTTIMAFLKFKDAGVDFAVLECGLGGRLDATNIVKPEVSAITSIGWDHMDALGETLESIAIQKAGIIKEGVPIVIGRETQHEILGKLAKEKGSPLITATPILDLNQSPHLRWQFISDNNDVAKAVLRQLSERGFNMPPSVVDQVEEFCQPCRFQKVDLSAALKTYPRLSENEHLSNLPVYLDVCHNLSSFEAVVSLLKAKYPEKKITAVCGFSKMKDITTILEYMVAHLEKIHFVQIAHFKLASLEKLLETAQKVEGKVGGKIQNIVNGGEVKSTIEEALQRTGKDEVVLVCGSFYIMDEVREFFGIEVQRDPKSANAN